MNSYPTKEQYKSCLVARSYDRERFSSLSGRLFNVLEKMAIRRAVQAVRKCIHMPSVLDAPCGTGRIAEMLLKMGLQVVGGDISAQMLEVAQRKCGGYAPCFRTKQIDLDCPDIPEASFDLVTCIRLFHHLNSAQRSAILCNLAKMTRRFVILNVSYSSTWYRFRRRIKRRLGQGVSKASSTWREVLVESEAAGLRVSRCFFVLPIVSEDLVLLLEKCQ